MATLAYMLIRATAVDIQIYISVKCHDPVLMWLMLGDKQSAWNTAMCELSGVTQSHPPVHAQSIIINLIVLQRPTAPRRYVSVIFSDMFLGYRHIVDDHYVMVTALYLCV